MSTYVVASKANQPYLSEVSRSNQFLFIYFILQCQLLGEYLSSNTPDVEVKYIVKDNSEWPLFVDSVCRSYGFDKKTCPIVYTLEGKLIGDGRAFIEHVREKFDVSQSITKDAQKNRTQLNIKENDDRIRKNKDGESLQEKIENHLTKQKKKKVAELIDDAFYEEYVEKGILFKVRRTNVLRDMPVVKKIEQDDDDKKVKLNINKTLNVPDEELKRHMEMEK